MNFAFLASIAWFFSNNDKQEEITVLSKDRFITGGVFMIQNEADGHILIANSTKVPPGQPADVVTDRWRVTTKGGWLLSKTLLPFPRNDTYILKPINYALNGITNSKENGVLRNDHFNYWKLEYGGRSFGADKWLIVHAGSTGDSNSTYYNIMNVCLENVARGKHVIHRPCNKEVHKQRWKFCLFVPPD